MCAATVLLSFGASFAAPEAAVPAVAAALAGSWQQMRFIVSMKQAEQQLLKVSNLLLKTAAPGPVRLHPLLAPSTWRSSHQLEACKVLKCLKGFEGLCAD